MGEARRVFVTRALPGPPLDELRGAPGVALAVNPHDRPVTREELLAGARGAVALIPQLVDRIDAALLDALPELRLVANYAAGYDNVDLAAASARGVLVSNTPGVLTEATADLTLALLLAATRRVVEADAFVRAGRFRGWAPELLLGTEAGGKTLGIVGLGRIGRAVARRARAFGMELLYTGRTRRPPEESEGAAWAPLEELLARADVVTIHCPLNAETRHLFDARRLALLRPEAYLINMARGPIVDEAALLAALEAGRLRGAALDVFEREPEVTPGLLARPEVVLCPHLGSATLEARTAMAAIAVGNVLDLLAGRAPRTCVNPEVAS
ncbi:MAG: 2-hydroxyacid dehydrogenase [Planctomycetota bacterium]